MVVAVIALVAVTTIVCSRDRPRGRGRGHCLRSGRVCGRSDGHGSCGVGIGVSVT